MSVVASSQSRLGCTKFKKKNLHYFKNKRSTKKTDCISEFYGKIYIYYLLKAPASYKNKSKYTFFGAT